MTEKQVRSLLAENIKRLREVNKMTQEDLAFESGISVPFLSSIERGNKWPSPKTLSKISSVLNVEIHQLFLVSSVTDPEDRLIVSKFLDEIKKAYENAIDRVCEEYRQKL